VLVLVRRVLVKSPSVNQKSEPHIGIIQQRKQVTDTVSMHVTTRRLSGVVKGGLDQ